MTLSGDRRRRVHRLAPRRGADRRRARRVRVLDNFSTGLRGNLAASHPAPEIIEGDVADAAAVERAIDGRRRRLPPGGAGVGAAQRREAGRARNDVCATGTLHVLDAARRAGRAPRRLRRQRQRLRHPRRRRADGGRAARGRCRPTPRPSSPASCTARRSPRPTAWRRCVCASSTSSARASAPTAPIPASSPCSPRR